MADTSTTRIRIFIIIFLIGIIAFFDYWTDMHHRRYHILYEGLFFLPVMLSGLWFGLRGALAASMVITLVLIPSQYHPLERFFPG